MLHKLYDWTLSFADSRFSLWILCFIAFIESSVFPIPPHALMIPIIIAAPDRAFLIATVVTIGSVLGGALGYYIGAQLFETIGQPILEFYHKTDNFQTFKTQFNAQGHWAVLISGLTPFPYKVITITAGATGMSFVVFMLWSLVARATIFFVIATLLWKYGLPIRNFIEKRLGIMFMIFCAIFIIGITLVKFL